MSRFKRWLCDRFLPAYCREALTEENTRLRGCVEVQRQEIDRMKAYISGLETAIRTQRRVIIRNEVGK